MDADHTTLKMDSVHLKLKLSFHGQILDHLGIQMYQSPVAAVAELISNSWDADAEVVSVVLPSLVGKAAVIVLADNGVGMTFEECEQKYLKVGLNRRETPDAHTPEKPPATSITGPSFDPFILLFSRIVSSGWACQRYSLNIWLTVLDHCRRNSCSTFFNRRLLAMVNLTVHLLNGSTKRCTQMVCALSFSPSTEYQERSCTD